MSSAHANYAMTNFAEQQSHRWPAKVHLMRSQKREQRFWTG